MKSPPYMRTWVDDYIADTLELDAEEMGAYWLMLLHAWKQPDCSLPDDDRRLARIARVGLRRWKMRVRPAVLGYWKVEGGRLFNQKQRKEREFNARLSESKSRNAKARWDAQDTENKQTGGSGCNAGGQATGMRNLESQNPNNITPKGVCASGDAPAFTKDDFVESWNAVAAECGLAAMRKMTPARLRAFKVRQREYPEIEDWQTAFRCLRDNRWMHGDNKTGWRADADFFLQAKSFTKLVEGAYAQAD